MTREPRDIQTLLRRASWLSFWVGVFMLVIKTVAWWQTRSAAILSDAAESVVHIAAVGFVVYSLRLAQKPPDGSHPYGHAKVSFLSAGFEGGLITIAGVFILFEAIRQWVVGLEPQQLGLGTSLVALAVAINGALGSYLLRLGKRHESLILESNGRHVLSDVWTSVGVLAGVFLTWVTGKMWLDPLCAIFVALHLFRSGAGLMRRSAHGLMDWADPNVQQRIAERLDAATGSFGVTWHHMRHRHLGDGHWVDFHLVFEDETSVREAHRIATEIEREIREELGDATVVTTHLEPEEDHVRVHGHAPGEEDPLLDQ